MRVIERFEELVVKVLEVMGRVLDGDEVDVLTHPTVGPLFGSFKLEHHVYTIPFRLYNSWLHNNRTKIGLDMSQVKIPQMKLGLNQLWDTPSNDEKQWVQVNPSRPLS